MQEWGFFSRLDCRRFAGLSAKVDMSKTFSPRPSTRDLKVFSGPTRLLEIGALPYRSRHSRRATLAVKHVFPLPLFPEISAHGAVDDEVEAGVEGDEEGGDAGHDEHPAGEAEAGVLDLRDDEHLVEVEHEAGDGRGEEDEYHGEQHHLLVRTLCTFARVFTNQHRARMRLIGVSVLHATF